jgi:sucrose-6-phosphate hydrolase SacC (GH32 family)
MTIDETVQQAIRTDALYDETYRPQFHFTARANWLNDPNGLVYDQGEYHLFFQHNPTGIEWGNMTWGHATSRDLVHWEQLPNAIEPDPLGTIFSGSAVVDRHNSAGFQVGSRPPLVAIYTAAGDTSPESKGQPFTQCLAYSNDRGRTWTKYDGNPVLNHIVGGNRDPKVIWHAPTQRWIMALYLDGNEFGLFSSPDLKHWEPIQTLALPDCSECPDFFPLPVDGDKNHIKWVFTAANGHYLIGSFDGAKFTQEGGPFAADYGANYYAVQTYSDLPESDGRRIQVAWMAGGKYPQMPFNQQMSFPCELTLHTTPEGIRLYRRPIQEIQRLYTEMRAWRGLVLQPAEIPVEQSVAENEPPPKSPGSNPLADLSGELWDIEVEFELQGDRERDELEGCGVAGGATAFGLRVRGEAITYSVRERTVACLGRTAPLEPEGNRVTLRVLADRTSLEVFGNGGRVSLTSCFLPRITDRSVAVFIEGGDVTLVSIHTRALRSIWSP